jgi:hypothetical protein
LKDSRKTNEKLPITAALIHAAHASETGKLWTETVSLLDKAGMPHEIKAAKRYRQFYGIHR